MSEESTTQDAGVPIMIEADDTEGHSTLRAFVSEEDEQALRDALRSRGRGPINVRLEPTDEDDVEGHIGGGPGAGTAARVTLSLGDEDDVEGHVISLHFPTAEAADQFRRRLLATGVLAATLTVGAIGVANMPNIEIGGTGAAGTAVTEQAGPMDAHEGARLVNPGAAANEAWQEASIAEGERLTGPATGPMDATEARVQAGQAAAASEAWQDASAAEAQRQAGATGASGPMDATEASVLAAQSAAANEAWQEASIAEGERQSGAAAGPMDAHEGARFVNPASATDADRDLGLADSSAQAAADAQADASERGFAADSARLQAQADAQADASERGIAADSARLQAQADAQAGAGPMDAHEASDLVNPSVASTDANRDVGLADASGAAIMDSASGEDEDADAPSRGGYTPR